MPVVSQRLTVSPSGCLGDEIRVAVLLHQFGDAIERVVPGDALPLIRARRAVLGVLQPARAVDEVDEARRPSGTGCRD